MEDKKDLPKYLTLEKKFPCYNAVHKMGSEEGDTIVLVNPREVAGYMKRIPPGKLTTIIEICRSIAGAHKVSGCCSLTTGIFIMTTANAAEEARQIVDRSPRVQKESAREKGQPAHNSEPAGKDGEDSWLSEIPYWRTLKSGGFLNEKYPGRAEGQKKQLEGEGFTVLRKGKRFSVDHYEDFLIRDL